MSTSSVLCPCGSRLSYNHCCQPCHEGIPAKTPEALMRSRYTAFVLKLSEYLVKTWHPSTRPETLNLDEAPEWTSLQILSVSDQGNEGKVHFRATYKTGADWGSLEEVSDFIQEAGNWYYLSGKTSQGPLKPGRNDKCPCGSGRKFKVCCA